MTVGQQVGHRLGRLAAELAKAQTKAVGAGSLEIRRSVEREVRRVAPSGRLRNVGRSGSRLGVRYDIKGTRNPTALIRATGPWQLVEGDTQPHIITAKGLGGSRAGRQQRATGAAFVRAFGLSGTGAFAGARRSRGARALGGSLAGAAGGPRAYARHPGTKGRQPFARGARAGIPEAKRAVSREFAHAARRGMTG